MQTAWKFMPKVPSLPNVLALSQHFGLRGCQKHCTINMEDFTINKDGDNGNEVLLTLTEGPTCKNKTRS